MSSPNDYILSNLAALNRTLCRPKSVDSRFVWYSMVQCLDPETGSTTNAIIIIENYSFLSSGVPKFTLESIISISYFAKKNIKTLVRHFKSSTYKNYWWVRFCQICTTRNHLHFTLNGNVKQKTTDCPYFFNAKSHQNNHFLSENAVTHSKKIIYYSRALKMD